MKTLLPKFSNSLLSSISARFCGTTLEQVHAAFEYGHHLGSYRAADKCGMQERPHHRRLPVQTQSLHEVGTAARVYDHVGGTYSSQANK